MDVTNDQCAHVGHCNAQLRTQYAYNRVVSTVGDIGEFGLLERLARRVAAVRLPQETSYTDFRLRLGIGDDAAAWQTDGGVEVQTTDTMVEGVHFTQSSMPWRDVGWKIMAANLSDIAAMGAVPLCAILTLGLPPSLPVTAVDEFYTGLLEACSRYHTQVVGGDIVRSDQTFFTVAIVGRCQGEPLRRSAARPGDTLAVTGPLGASAGGLRLLTSGSTKSDPQTLINAHHRPNPRIDAGQHILLAGCRCAMDISDGLLADLGKLGRASGVGLLINAGQVPIDPSLERQGWGDVLELALAGGEDYELVYTAPRKVIDQVLAKVGGAIIGEVTTGEPGSVSVVDANGNELHFAHKGWDHLVNSTDAGIAG